MASNPSAAGNNKSGAGSSSGPALYVTPLNSMRYIGPTTPPGENTPLPTDGVTKPASSPTFLLLPAEKSPEELKTILDSDKGTVKDNLHGTPSWQFSLAFNLPGPVDHLQFTGTFKDGGMLEGIVKKK